MKLFDVQKYIVETSWHSCFFYELFHEDVQRDLHFYALWNNGDETNFKKLIDLKVPKPKIEILKKTTEIN